MLRPSSILVSALTLLLAVATLIAADDPTTTDAARRHNRKAKAELFGGSDVPDSAYPFVATLGTVGAAGGFDKFFCGGSLIAPSYVLTAAHCMRGETPGTVAVVVGQTVRGSAEGVARSVTGIAVHPEYNSKNGMNDVAVLTLNEPVTSISPMALLGANDESFQAAGNQLTVAGWGDTVVRKRKHHQNLTKPATRMQQATVTVISDAACAKKWKVKTGKRYILDPITMCTSAKHGPGDSGGPVFTAANGSYLQVSVMTSAYGGPRPHRVADFGPQLSAPGIRGFITSIAGV